MENSQHIFIINMIWKSSISLKVEKIQEIKHNIYESLSIFQN